MKTKELIWSGYTRCDGCGYECGEQLYDTRTKRGPWAVLCERCYPRLGCGELGTGLGQRYMKSDAGYLKVEG